MKYFLYFILSLLFFTACTSTEQITNLNKKISSIESQLDNYANEIEALKKENLLLQTQFHTTVSEITKFNANEALTNSAPAPEAAKTTIQCQATTAKGTQCTRTASLGSIYCWQHQNKDQSKSTVSPSSNSDRTIYTGPRGGQYYINKNGNKTYIKKK